MDDDETNNHQRCSKINWKDMNDKLGTNKLSVLCFNVCSIQFKFPEFCSSLLLLKNQYSFIVITETWLNVNKDFALEITGLNLLYSIDQLISELRAVE